MADVPGKGDRKTLSSTWNAAPTTSCSHDRDGAFTEVDRSLPPRGRKGGQIEGVEEVPGKEWLEPGSVERRTMRSRWKCPQRRSQSDQSFCCACAGTVTSKPSRAGSASRTLRRNETGFGRCSFTSQSRTRRMPLRCPAGKSAKSVWSSTTQRR